MYKIYVDNSLFFLSFTTRKYKSLKVSLLKLTRKPCIVPLSKRNVNTHKDAVLNNCKINCTTYCITIIIS